MASRLGIGAGIGIPFRNIASGGGKPYLSPEVKEALKAVVIAYGKTNNDSDRAIVKNLVDASNPFIISNSAFKLNSGFGKYGMDFLEWKSNSGMNFTSTKLTSTKPNLPGGWLTFRNVSGLISETKVKVSGAPKEFVFIGNNNGADDKFSVTINNGVYTIPEFTLSSASGFYINNNSGDWSNLVIEQIPSFEGAFVTDGIDDLITSTKTVQEMLGGSNEITVVSMIHQIGLIPSQSYARNNYFIQGNDFLTNTIIAIGKIGIYGYKGNLSNIAIVNDILGDKKDYSVDKANPANIDSVFSVNGTHSSAQLSSVAWYWTIIANKVLTTDQINQVIAYFNLDRTLKPDILCDVKKQGITNENHAEFGDKLIDFSGNGRDIQLNNIAWKGDSGIGKYETDFTTWTRGHFTDEVNFTPSKIEVTGILTTNSILINNKPTPIYNVEIHSPNKSIVVYYQYNDDTGVKRIALVDGINELPSANDSLFVTSDRLNSKGITITQIPSHAGALCLDGINDFGKVTGMPIYKDYTFIIEREFLNETFPNQACLASKSKVASEIENGGAFIVDNISVNSIINPYSFYKTTSLPGLNTFDRQIVFQSKYKYLDKDIAAGTATDSDTLWLGTFRDNDSRFANVAIYSLMSFPYSMSKFLIERQLKKHKLGTLYPDMVEFRPIIKQDDRIKSIKYYIDGKTANIGQYYPIGTALGIAVETVQPYMVKSLKVNGVNTIPNVDYKGFNARLDSKSPQKITMDIVVDSSLVQWNPVVESNAEYQVVDFYINTYPAVVGNYYPINSKLTIAVTTKGAADEVTSLTVNGVSLGTPSINGNRFTFNGTLPDKSPQNINIAIDEYIRFEDIVQPYPVLLRFKDENGNEVSWGGKFRVGSTITRIGSAADSNLLPNIYNIFGLLLNDNQVTSSKVIVEKTMVFKAKSAYIFDNNEPKVILSPSRLRIPNSSYKILGYIPDISGHGNHGVIHNSAYTGMSGANGYTEDFTKWTLYTGVKCTDSIISLDSSFNKQDQWILFKPKGSNINQFTINIKGIPDGGNLYLRLSTDSNIKLENGINEISSYTNVTNSTGFFIGANGLNLDWSNLVIEQVGEYEGAYCLDGVDDFVTIPTLSSGGKQVLMKVNLPRLNEIIYDQRKETNTYTFAILTTPSQIAYYQRNSERITYIDGILNTNIIAKQLMGVTHNIVVINSKANLDNTRSPILGRDINGNNWSRMRIYDFMLFDDISTDDKIKELNEYIGIEAKVELPPYYWDAYGKTNFDVDKATIQQRGVAVGDYDLTNYNHAYDKMSGYGGYSLGRFDKSWASSSSNNTSVIVVSRNPYDITLKKLGGNSDWEFNNTELKVISNPVSVKFKSNKNIRVTCDYHYYPVGGNSEGAPLGITSKDLIANKDAIITISPISQENIDKYNIDVNRGYYLIYFQLSSTLAVNEEVTIEMLPLYPNGLVYDGVDDYSKNENIPVLTDYTIIAKRLWINKDNPLNEQFIHKGAINTPIRESAFMLEYEIGNDTYYRSSSYGGYINIERSNRPERIVYQTSNSYNGTSITKGSGTDTTGIVIGGVTNNYWNGVFYKLMLYSKTLPLLQINYLKNLMEKDEIIDLNNKIFIQE